MRRRQTYNDACGPRVEEEDGAHQEGARKDYADGQQKPVAQADVLFPKQKGVAVGIVLNSLAHELFANGAHALDGLDEVGRLSEAVHVKRKLRELQRLGCRD